MKSYFARLKENFLSFLDSFYSSVPKRRSYVHCGIRRKDDIRYKKILLVDDIPQYVENSLGAITNHYIAGEVTISMAYTYYDALEIFSDEKNDLVVLDFDLQDDVGDGTGLARRFKQLHPDVVILANSKIKKYNNYLLESGAEFPLGKRVDLLLKWLSENDPIEE